MQRIDLETVRREIEERGNYEHDGYIVIRTRYAIYLLEAAERLRDLEDHATLKPE